MINCLYIDGTDALAAWGVWIPKGGYDDLFAFPALKEPDANDWKERDGLECDLTAPKLEALTVKIDFVASGKRQDTIGFLNALSKPGVRQMQFTTLGRTFALRLKDAPNLRRYSRLDSFSLDFVMDTPDRTSLYVRTDPQTSLPTSAYKLDGVGLEHYGIFVESGRDALLRPATMKEQLTRNISTVDGQIYNPNLPTREAKQTTFKCCLKALDMFRMWSCRDAFFSALIQPGWHTLDYKGTLYECRYVSAQNFRLAALRQNLAMIEFELTMSINRQITN